MILEDAKLDKLIAEYETKMNEGYRNYQDTGNGRYWNTYKKYEDLSDTLKVAKNYKSAIEKNSKLESKLKDWAGTVSKMPYFSSERREDETRRIINEIVDAAREL